MSNSPASSNKKAETATICLPGEDGWERWKPSGDGYQLSEKVATADGGSAASFKEIQVYGFPVTAAYAIPIWASTADENLLSSVVDMQLEKLGMRPETIAGKLVDYTVVDREEAQTLTLATVLDSSFKHELPKGGARDFEASPALFYLPENQVVLWKELGRLVVAITRRDMLVYFQGLTASRVDAGVVHELNCLLMQLGMQKVVEQIDGVTLWTDAVDEGVDALLSDTFECKVHHQKRPAPVLPLQNSTLLPTEVALDRIEVKKRQKIKNALLLAGLVYCAIAAFFVARYLIDLKEVNELKQVAASKQRYFDLVPRVQGMWGVALETMDVDRYPLEVFNRIVEPLKQLDQVNLEAFNISSSKVQVSGMAKDAAMAIRFQQQIKDHEDLQDFEWKMPQPTPEKRTGRFRFQLNGERNY